MEFLFVLLVASAAAAVVDGGVGGFPTTVLTFERAFPTNEFVKGTPV